MKKNISFLVVLFCFFYTCVQLQAQEKAANIVQDLEVVRSDWEGVIHIESDTAITALVGNPNTHINTSGNFGFVEKTGFRIQVFMGNNPGSARSEASSKQEAIKEAFPETSTYLTYEAPNWRLFAGDFVSREEAAVFKEQLQKAFPQFGKEMYIVVDKIKIPIEIGE